MCVLDVHVGETEIPTGSLGDDPQMSFPWKSSTPGDMCAIDLEFMTAMNSPRTGSTPARVRHARLNWTP